MRWPAAVTSPRGPWGSAFWEDPTSSGETRTGCRWRRPTAAPTARRPSRRARSSTAACSAAITAGASASGAAACWCPPRSRACPSLPEPTWTRWGCRSATASCGCARESRARTSRRSSRRTTRRSAESTPTWRSGRRRPRAWSTTSWTSPISRSCTPARSAARPTRWCRGWSWSSWTTASSATPTT